MKGFKTLLLLLIIFEAEAQTCGRPKGIFGTVVNGVKAKKNEWPWLVAFVEWTSGKFFCGGSLLSQRHVLSGEHFKLSSAFKLTFRVYFSFTLLSK